MLKKQCRIILFFSLFSLTAIYSLLAETRNNLVEQLKNQTTIEEMSENQNKSQTSEPFYWLYLGTSTAEPTKEMKMAGIPKSEGLYAARFYPEDGRIEDIHLAVPMRSSSFIAMDDEKGILYVVGQAQPEDGNNNVYAYKIDRKTGNLTYINHQSVKGLHGCHLSLHPKRTFLAVANYSSGDFAVLRINSDGSIGEMTGFVKKEGNGPNQRRQDSAKGHAAYFIENEGITRIFMVDLGSDKVYIQKLNEETGEVQDDPQIPVLECPPGSGPRHLAWSTNPEGILTVYVLNELDSTLSIFGLDFRSENNPQNRLTCWGTWSTIEEKYRDKLTDEVSLVDGINYKYGNKTSEIEILPIQGSLRLYASNRGQNSIVVFDVNSFNNNGATPCPILLQREPTKGEFPRFFMSDPTGRFLLVANKMSGSIYVFEIEKESGNLILTSDQPSKLAWCIAMGFATPEK